MKTRPAVLVILDGWGWREETRDNAIAAARTPAMTRFAREYPTALLSASGEDVGLHPGLMGNSDVGHLTIGSGRVVFQMLPRIDRAVAQGTFAAVPAVAATFDAVGRSGGTLHLLGLLSDGGVHSMETHLHALLREAAARGLPADRVAVHAFLDGRDVPPESAATYLERLEGVLAQTRGRLATVQGRYWAMDRDKRWDRTKVAWDAIAHGIGDPARDWRDALARAKAAGETDEFVKPRVCASDPRARLAGGDAAFFFNFRADRMRQIVRATAFDDFAEFDRGGARPALAAVGAMCLYDPAFAGATAVAYPPEYPEGVLADVVSRAGLRQYHTAETEKYAHVTYFLNGGIEPPFPLEERCLVPSPRDVATYDQRPEMNAAGVCEKVIEAIAADHALVVANFANADMVGHTGIFDATVKACEAVDAALVRVHEACRTTGRALLVSADHGNAELMRDAVTGAPHTAHTTSPVPVHVVGEHLRGKKLRDGGLRDIAPTVLAAMGLEPSPGMTGRSLLED